MLILGIGDSRIVIRESRLVPFGPVPCSDCINYGRYRDVHLAISIQYSTCACTTASVGQYNRYSRVYVSAANRRVYSAHAIHSTNNAAQ